MFLLILFLFSFQQPVDSLDIDYRLSYVVDTHTEFYRIAFNPNKKDLFIYSVNTGVLYKKNIAGITPIDTLDRYLIGNTKIFYDLNLKKLKFIDGGLGRVFNYDINSKKLERYDKSYNFRSFYGFRGQIGKEGQIYTYGGSGEFLTKNLILTFNRYGFFEWWKDDTIDQRTNPSTDNFVIDFVKINNFYLFNFYIDKLVVYQTVNLGDKKTVWKKLNQYPFKLLDFEWPSTLYNFSNYKLFGSKYNFSGIYFYDFENMKLQKWVTDKKVYGVFNPSIISDSLHVVYTMNGYDEDPFEFEIETYAKVDFFDTNTFEIIESDYSRISKFMILILVTLVLIVLYIAMVRNRKVKNTHPISISEFSVIVETKKGRFSFTERTEIDLFKIINQLYNSDINKIELDQLDDLLFHGLGYKTHITTRRNQLFDNINNALGQSLIRKQKSSSDRRRKIVVFDYSIL